MNDISRSADESRYTAPALEKGLRIVEVLVASERPLSTSEIALAVGRSRNEIYRVLQSLEQQNYIERRADLDGYIPTYKLFGLAMRSAPVLALNQSALPEMHKLCREVGHSVQLVVPSGDQIVFIGNVESEAVFGFAVRLGYRRPLLVSSAGRILFAFQTDERRTSWLKELSHNAPPGADIQGFQKDAKSARREGFIVRKSFTVEGVTDICAPIWSSKGEGCVASLLVPYMQRYGEAMTAREVAERTRAAADRITSTLRRHLFQKAGQNGSAGTDAS